MAAKPNRETLSAEMRVVELRDYLRVRGKPVGGNKAALIDRVLTFWDDPILGSNDAEPEVDPVETELEEQRKIFESDKVVYEDVLKTKKVKIMSGFDLDKIYSFLTVVFVSAAAMKAGEVINVGTEKPTVKGREMYLSSKVMYCEHGQSSKEDGDLHIFRANMTASYKKDKEEVR